METTRASLLIRIRDRRDDAAWREFDAIYRPLISGFARARGLSHADVEDVVQHCMAAISRHIESFEYDPRRGRFKGWLRTIVDNRVRNLLRDRREQPIADEQTRLPQQRESPPDEVFERIWVQEHLRHCLRRVAAESVPAEMQAFERYALDEWPAERVCGEFGMTPPQLYKLKWRITQRIAAAMTDLLGEPEEPDATLSERA